MTEPEFRALLNEKGYLEPTIRDWQPDLHNQPHTHDQSVLLLLLEGNIGLEISGSTVWFSEQDCCELPADTLHCERTTSAGAKTLIAVKPEKSS